MAALAVKKFKVAYTNLLLRHEYHPWDWINVSNPALGLVGSYCGGPKAYDWPTAQELDPNGIYSTNEAAWNGATTQFVGDSVKRHRHVGIRKAWMP
jgi:hypothetical protein